MNRNICRRLGQRHRGTVSAVAISLSLMLSTPLAHAQSYSLATLGTFTGGDTLPTSGVTGDGSGNLFGTTVNGGSGGDGTVFKLSLATNALSTVATFSGANGSAPQASLLFDPSGNLYGTTQSGGTNGDGTVFMIAAGSTSITTIASFAGTNGAQPLSGLTRDSVGDLFGTTSSGAGGFGTVYEILAGTNTITTLLTFNGTNGGEPQGNLILDSGGNLYGTTTNGGTAGASSEGTVFELAVGTHTLTTLATFTGDNGAFPAAGLVRDSAGNLYGVTQAGGTSNDGILFKVAAGTNTLSTLATFNGANGSAPESDLIMDSAGNIFGETNFSGASGDGTVFEYSTTTNFLNTIATFSSTSGGSPSGGLTFGAGSALFGTTENDGGAPSGTVFELSPVGSATAPEPGAIRLLLSVAVPLCVMRRRWGSRRARR